MDLGLRNHVAVVTGGTRGIGRAICRGLLAEGCHVSLCARDAAEIEATVGALRTEGVRVRGGVADVTVAGQLEKLIDETAEEFGRLDHVVANVGGMVRKNALEASVEDWMRTFELNIGHAVRAIRSAVPHMRQPEDSSVVIIASVSGLKPGPYAQYGAAKAAEIFLAGSLARELASRRIRVNTISPGSISLSRRRLGPLQPGAGAEIQDICRAGVSVGPARHPRGSGRRRALRPIVARSVDQRRQYPGRRRAE